MSYRIAGGDFNSAGAATRQLKEQLVRIGVGAAVIRRVMIASYEAEMNVVIHARTGTLWARLDGTTLDLEVADEGPGIPDIGKAMTEGWSTASEKARALGFGAGMGLPNIRKNSDLFEIETRVGRGTRVRSRIRLEGLATTAAGATDAVSAAVAAEAPLVEARACRRCLRCIFSCPSSALRVHESGPSVIPELCIGCTSCITACSSGVFRVAEPADTVLSVPHDAVLVLPRAFLAGFGAEADPGQVLAGLSRLGFTEVRFTEEWEAAVRAAARSAACAADRGPLPVIAPVCPAAIALVESRYPSLIPLLGPWMSPVEAAGEEFPLKPVVIVAACPSQYARGRASSLTDRLTMVSPGALKRAVRGKLDAAPRAGRVSAPGDTAASVTARGEPEQALSGTLRVTGIRHVTAVLAAVEAGTLSETRLLDLSLCDTGCSGSPLLCADPYLAAERLGSVALDVPADTAAAAVTRRRLYAQRPGLRLDPDMGEAIRKLGRIDAAIRTLPGRDCGACGAPTCAAFAEDLILGRTAQACPHANQEVAP